MLGSEAAPDNSAELSPEVTTYTLPVPVFGDTSAVEGVLTAARHTAAQGLAGIYVSELPASFNTPARGALSRFISGI
jgi:hypothetical protein